MSSIDERVVKMEFQGDQFNKKAAEATTVLEKLKAALDSIAQGKTAQGVTQINQQLQNADFSAMSNGIAALQDRFSTLGIVGMRVIQRLTDSAMNFASRIMGFVTSGIVSGGISRAMNIEQAKFQLEGLGVAWSDIEDDINYGVRDTAYGLDAAAKVASQLVASGVQVGDQMATDLRAISGVAAMTNSSYEEIGHIFTTVASNGRLMTEQLRQFSYRGLNVSAVLAEQLGKTEAEINTMVSQGKIDFQTFADAMDAAFGDHAKDANKTFTGAMANTRAALARIGAKVATQGMESLKDIFNALIPLINAVNKALDPFINLINSKLASGSASLVAFLTNRQTVSGFEKIAGALSSFATGLDHLIAPIKQAFQDIFPSITPDKFEAIADAILNIANAFEKWAAALTIVKDDLGFDTLATSYIPTFKGLFAVLDIVRMAIEAIVYGFKKFLEYILPADTRLMDFTNNIGDFLTRIHDSIRDNDLFIKFIDNLANGLKPVGDILKVITDGIFDSLNKIDFNKMISFISNIVTTLSEGLVPILETIFEQIKRVVWVVKTFISELFGGVSPLEAFSTAMAAWLGIFTVDNLNRIPTILNSIRDYLFRGDWLGLGKKFKFKLDFFAEQLGLTLATLTANINAKTLKDIATGLLLLALALKVLSTIDAAGLAKSLTAVTVLMVELGAMLEFLASLHGSNIFASLDLAIVGTTLIKLAASILILSIAMKLLSGLSWEDIGKGLLAITVLLAELAAVAEALSGPKASKMMKGAGGLVFMALAVVILAHAVKKFGEMDPETLINGISALTAVLFELAAFTKFTSGSKGMVGVGIGLVLLAASMEIFIDVIKKLADISGGNLLKGLASLGGLLVGLGVALRIMPKDTLSKGVGITVLAAGMILLTKALENMAALGADNLGVALIGLASAMVILAVALNAMQGTLGGAAALVVASIGILAIATAISVLGKLKLKQVVVAIVALVGVLVIMAGAAVLLSAAAGPILAMAGAILALGAAVALVGVGLMAFALGLEMLYELSKNTGLVTGLGASVSAALQVVKDKAPEFAEAGFELFMSFLKGIRDNIGEILTVAYDIAINFLNAIAEKAPEIMSAGADVIVALLKGLGDNADKISEQGATTAIQLIEALTNTIDNHHDEFVQAVVDLILAASGVPESARTKFKEIGKSLAKAILSGIASAFTSPAVMAALSLPAGLGWTLYNKGKSLGARFSEGVAAGIGAGVTNVANAALRVASAATSAVAGKKGWIVKSPSRIGIRLGAYFSEGLAIGIDRLSKRVEVSSSNVANMAINGLSNLGSTINNSLNDIDYYPVIRPVMDLTDIQNGINTINNAAYGAGRYSMGLIGGLDSSIASNNHSIINNHLDFRGTQYNNRAIVERYALDLIEALIYEGGANVGRR